MEKKKRISKWKIGVGIGLVCLLVFLLVNAAVEANPWDSGGCFSVTFDKLAMATADRAVIVVGEERYEISDIQLVRDITEQTMCATNTDLCCSSRGNRWIEIYRGESLVRRMRWEEFHDSVIVYEADLTHWVFPSSDGHGLVSLSDELLAELKAVIGAD